MTSRFACEMIFQLSSLPAKERIKSFGGRLLTTVVELSEDEVEIDDCILMPIVFEHPEVQKMKDGIYKVFIIGNFEWQSSIHPVLGTDEGDWYFEETEITFIPLSVKPSEQELRKLKHIIR